MHRSVGLPDRSACPGRRRSPSRRHAVALLAMAVVALAALGSPPVASAAGPTLYVDGKTGNDANDGRSPATAFRTIQHAADSIPKGTAAAGSRVIVRGYTDYVYRERPISSGWNRTGKSGAPIKFEAAGYVAGGSGYVKPIVSGADAAPRPGQAWQSVASGVWRTAWAEVPFDFGKGLRTAAFQDDSQWLWERGSVAELSQAAASGEGGYFYAPGWLYVAPVGAAAGSPGGHAFDVVERNGFYFKGDFGTKWVEVRGFEVRHSANGIAFKSGVDHGFAADNLLVGNLYMGIQVSGDISGGVANPATHNIVKRNVFRSNTLQGIKIDRGTQYSTFCDNDVSTSGMAGIKLQGAPPGTSNVAVTRYNNVCNNDLHDNTFNRTGSPYANTSGITIANGARSNTIQRNRIYRNLVGIHVTQEGKGRRTLDGNVLAYNRIFSNSRYGIYFYDGMYGSGSGKIVSRHDLIWGNGTGVRVDRGSTNKILKMDTIYGNLHDGVQVGLGGGAYAHVLLKRTLVTNNRGYAVNVRGRSTAALKYVGLRANSGGAYRGTVSRKAVNHWAPKYLSRMKADPGFLRISKTSRDYTAGPHGKPIGARW
jgi:Right handed beta helix region